MHPFLHESQARGFLHQTTDLEGLNQFLKTRAQPAAYIGFDATAPSLQVGNLVSVMWLRLMQKHGIRPIILLGGATTQIGDPSFRDASRPLLSIETIHHHLQTFQETFSRFIHIGDGATDGILVNNIQWLGGLNYIDFLREYGCHLTINRMLSFDSVRTRLDREQPLTFLEFNYMIFQAYDFLHLSRQYDCWIQMGGSDQWGNIVNGIELIRRADHRTAFGVTSPLVTNAHGAKMGKTADGAVWVHPNQLSPYAYWQFWRNTDDRDVMRYLRLFTDLPLEEIHALSALDGAELNAAKIMLADATTVLAHGRDSLASVHQDVAQLFGSNSCGHIRHDSDASEEWPKMLDALLVELRCVESKGEAKRLIHGRGVTWNGVVLDDPKCSMAFSQEPARLAIGKKKRYLVHCSPMILR